MSILLVDITSIKGSPSGLCWRLVHDGTMVLHFFESNGVTRTRKAYFAATTEKECLDKIVQLKLNYKPEIDKVMQKSIG